MTQGAWEEFGSAGVRWLQPRALPLGVRVAMTFRSGGVSRRPYASLNLAAHVGDDPAAVAANRRRVRRALDLPGEPCWLRQVHGTSIATGARTASNPEADGAVTGAPGQVLAVLTADCLPVVLVARTDRRIAVAHAGWRGLAGGVLEAALDALGAAASGVEGWIAPGIGAANYVVGDDVCRAFRKTPGWPDAFAEAGGGAWRCDLAALARARLEAAGVTQVWVSGACTYEDAGRFYSYRRDGETGRTATLAWIEPGGA